MNVHNNIDDDDDVDYECPICYVAFDDESTVIQCRNGHSFHGKCLEQWDQNSESSGTTLNCPTCSVTMNKRLPITNRFATKASKLAEEVKLLKAQLEMEKKKLSEKSSSTSGLQQQQNSQSSSDFNVNQFADNGQIKYLSEGFRSYVNKKINDFIQNDTAEQLCFSHKIVGACRDYIFRTGTGLGLLCRSKKITKKKKGVVLTKKSEEQKKKAALKRERKKIHNANIIANSIQINTDAGCFVKESKGKPKHWYCEHCVFERKYEDHINFAHHLFSNKHKTQQNMSNRLKEYAKNGELFVNNKPCLTFPIAQGIAATWKCKECNFTVNYDNPYGWIWHKNWANKLHAGQEINKPTRGKKKKKKQKRKKKQQKQASTSYRTIMKRKHVDGGDSVYANRKRSNTLMHYPCNTRVSMVWPDNMRYHGVVSKIDKRGRHTVIWDEDQTETIGLKYSQLETST